MCLADICHIKKHLWHKWMDIIGSQGSVPPTTFLSKYLSFERTQWLSCHSPNMTAIHSLCLWISWSLCLKCCLNLIYWVLHTTLPANSNSLFTASSLRRGSSLPQDKWGPLGMAPWTFPSRHLLFELLFVGLHVFPVHWIQSEQKDDPVDQTPVNRKLCCRHYFFCLPSLTFNILAATLLLLQGMTAQAVNGCHIWGMVRKPSCLSFQMRGI